MENKHLIHQNFDTSPKLLGIFSYTNILLTLSILLPLAYIIINLNLSLSTKIYGCACLIFPSILVNVVFADTSNIYLYLWYMLKYVFTEKVYIYSKVPLSTIFPCKISLFLKRINF